MWPQPPFELGLRDADSDHVDCLVLQAQGYDFISIYRKPTSADLALQVMADMVRKPGYFEPALGLSIYVRTRASILGSHSANMGLCSFSGADPRWFAQIAGRGNDTDYEEDLDFYWALGLYRSYCQQLPNLSPLEALACS
jgi:hypothetical protein